MVDAGSEAGRDFTSFACIQKMILDVFLATQMNQIWSVINSLQIFEYSNLFDTHVPGSVAHMSTYFNDITEFDILPSKKILSSSVYIPEIPPFSLNFQNAGYESKLMLVNNRPFVVNISVYWAIIGLHSMIYLCTRKCQRMNGCNRKVSRLLYWNSGIRFYTETYMVCILFAMLNYYELEWVDGLTAVYLTNYITYTYLIIAFLIPIFFAVFYYRNR